MTVEQTLDAGLDQFGEFLIERFGSEASRGRIIRDVFGRLSYISPNGTAQSDVDNAISQIPESLNAFLLPNHAISSPGSRLAQPFLSEGGVIIRGATGIELRLLDRRLAGDSWLAAPISTLVSVPRIAFYGIKGGVGRSTALAVCAADLASKGRNVLVVDLDLEAPGLESTLLLADRQPDYGVLDWMAAGTAGLDASSLIVDMVGGSPFTSGSGVVDVVPVIGTKTLSRPSTFLAKLARAYTPGAPSGPLMRKSFTEKIEFLLCALLEQRPYDVVMLDVRAGLHETSAAALLGLGATCLLFGTEAPHTKSGYDVLLATIRQSMESWKDAPDLRNRFRMVHGRAPASMEERRKYRASCWDLWLRNLYDASGEHADISEFTFDLDDNAGPHFPLVVPASESFSIFDPANRPDSLSDAVYRPVFGDLAEFVSGVVKNQVTV